MRDFKIKQQLSYFDTWNMWLHLAVRAFGLQYTTMIFIDQTPVTIDVCTSHQNVSLNMEMSSQHSIDVVVPYKLFHHMSLILHPSMSQYIKTWKVVMDSLLTTDTANYSEVWWRTSETSVFEIDLIHYVCYKYDGVVAFSIDGDTQLLIPNRRTCVTTHTVLGHLVSLFEYLYL